MAVIYNNQVCVFANELITRNKKSGVGSDSGLFLKGLTIQKPKEGK